MNNKIPYDFADRHKDCDGNITPPSAKGYFDYLSHEFGREPIENKALILARLIHYGFDLPAYLRAYKDRFENYITRSLACSLLFYIQTLRWGETIHYTNTFMEDNMGDMELAILLQEELKARYTIWEGICEDKLVLSLWGEQMFEDICHSVDGDKEKFRRILTTAEFSSEHKDDYKL